MISVSALCLRQTRSELYGMHLFVCVRWHDSKLTCWCVSFGLKYIFLKIWIECFGIYILNWIIKMFSYIGLFIQKSSPVISNMFPRFFINLVFDWIIKCCFQTYYCQRCMSLSSQYRRFFSKRKFQSKSKLLVFSSIILMASIINLLE